MKTFPRLILLITSIAAAIFTIFSTPQTNHLHPDPPLNTTRHLSTQTQIEILRESPTSPFSPALLHVQILSPKNLRKFQYSVILLSEHNYTGVATLISDPTHDAPLLFEWSPVVEGLHEILVHEIPIANDKQVEILPFERKELLIERQEGYDQYDASVKERLDSKPCSLSDRSDVYSVWDGDWLGPGSELVDSHSALRTEWMFLPSKQMNCTIPTYSSHDLMHVQKETSIFVLGTSRERGVFLSLLDLLLSPEEKEHLDVSVIGKCWGRATIQKNNIQLLYQDFRVIHFEPPGAIRTMECHNDKIAKMSDALFIENAWMVWEELFESEERWPDVVYMLTNDGPNYDFEYHTKSFVTRLPPSWNGTLIFSDYSFTARRPNLEYVEKHTAYRSDLKDKLQLLNDPRVRWLDGMGIAKEMRLHGEWGEHHMGQSQHFHRFCNETNVDLDSNVQIMNVCSNITEMVAQILLGHAIGPKESIAVGTVATSDAALRYCHSCPKRLLPFHITPNPKMTCEMGPLHVRTDGEELVSICSESSEMEAGMCPDSCMMEDVSYQFESQSDVVDVRECEMQATDTPVTVDEPLKTTAESMIDENDAIPSWLRRNLADVSAENKCEKSNVPFYWNIPESGGTTIQNLYWCMGLTIANEELGTNPKFGYANDTKLVKFLPFHGMEWPIINVDLSTKEGIMRAKNLGLVASTNPSVDLVVSSHLRFAAEELFDPDHKGKVFTVFRHPARIHHQTNDTIDNWMVRYLVGKEDPNEHLNDQDLVVAKEIVRTKIVVGLDTRFTKSFDRFNVHLGIHIYKRWTRGKCIRDYVRKNDNDKTPTMTSENGLELKDILERNAFDLLLYEYAEGLFNENEFESEVSYEDSS